MSEVEHFYFTYHPQTGEPIGVFDAWRQPPRRTDGFGPVIPSPLAVQIPFGTQQPRQRPVAVASGTSARAYLWLAAAVFAAGLFAGCVLFGSRNPEAPTVVVCQAPNSYPFAPQSNSAPANCAPVHTVSVPSRQEVGR